MAARTLAQSENTFEASVTHGAGTGGHYLERSDFGLRASVSGREWNHGKNFGVYAEGTLEFLSIASIYNGGCLGSTSCLAPYPQFSGIAATAGVTVAPTPHLEFRLGGGGGGYVSGGTYAAAYVAQVDVALPGPSIGVIAGARDVVMPSFKGSRLSSLLFSVGALLPLR